MKMLSYLVGEETFLQILREFYNRYKFSTATFDDFAQVADSVSGQNLDWFFDEWVNTNKKLDYAIKSVSCKKTKQGGEKCFANRVVVNRRGEAIMPLEVQIGLQNGEKVSKKMEGKEKTDTLDFVSSSRMSSVTLDPEHRLLDIDRYNNKRPAGLKFDLLNYLNFGFSNDECYHVLLLPSFARSEDHGWEYGIGLQGMGGIPQGGVYREDFKSNITYNRLRRAFNTVLDYSYSSLCKNHKAFVGGISLSNKNGKRGGELYFERINYDGLGQLWGTWKLSLGEYEYYSLSYLSRNIWQEGRTALLSLSYKYNDFKREQSLLKGLMGSVTVDCGLKALGGKRSYRKIAATAQIFRKGVVVWTALGATDGSLFFQDKYDLAAQGNFRGLPLHGLVGRKIVAGGVVGRIHTPILLALFPFLTAGNLPKGKQAYYEGGIGLGIGLREIIPAKEFRIDFPFWENKPLAGEKEWDWKRFQIRLGVPFSPDQWYQKRRS